MKNRRVKGKTILIILSIFAAVKMLFFAFGLDEEYQLVMAYRNVRGAELFLTMWEPHQTSAFLCALLMRPYLALIGTTGVVIWLRLCGTLIHLGVSFYLYSVLRRMISGDSAFLLGLIYFNTIPKQIMLPEFGIMQVWFLTLLSLFLIQYYDIGVINEEDGIDTGAGSRKYLIFASFALVLEVLSYPSCVLLYVLVLWILWRRSGKRRFADMGIVTGICGLCGAAYVGLLLRNNTPEGLLGTLSSIVNGDITHSLSFADKLLALGRDILLPAALCAGIFLLSKAAARLTAPEAGRRRAELIWITALSCLTELCCWVVFNAGYESMQVHLIVFAVLGILYDIRCGRGREGAREASERRGHLRRGLLLDGIFLAGGALLAVLYLTDLGLMDSLPHAMTAAFFGMTIVTLYWEEKDRVAGGAALCLRAALLFWAFTAIFGKGYTLRSGTGYHNVLQSGGILKYGPAAGTISDYMCAYIYNCDYEDWQGRIQEGDRVLIMVDQVMNLGTIQYLFQDVEISHYSIVNPTAYDERLTEYWEMFPEKAPNVIIVDDWYGQLMTDPEGWLMRYAEGEFGYTSMEEGRYIRIYRKE